MFEPSSERATKSLSPMRFRIVDHLSSCTVPRALRVTKVVCSELGVCMSPLRAMGAVILGCIAGLFIELFDRALRQKLAIIPVASRGVMVLELLFPAIDEVVGAASVYCSRKIRSVSTMVSVLRRWERGVV